jgi:glycosyltransferase involved in cell wall biosynthesis
MKRLIKATTRALGLEIHRYRPGFATTCVSLSATGSPRKGNVLIAYILDPFLRRSGEEVSTTHTHHHESLLMAQVWREQGYDIDIIDYRNHEFIPNKRYDFFVSARTHLERIAGCLNPDCVKIVHLDTSHFAFNNHATHGRILSTQQRRSVSLPGSMRLVEANRAIECADYGVVLGNGTTASTYRYAGKPLFTLNVPSAVEFPVPDTKDFTACRSSFLWFGSGGMVHKGLDLALEAFSTMPEMHLTVCGPVAAERDFQQLYRRELHETANIRTVGWVDVAGTEFARIIGGSIGVVYPSCAEGQAGSVVTCLRAGLLPIVSAETGLDVTDFGWILNGASVEEICRAVRDVASLPPAELAARARRAWEYAASCHSHDSYLRDYGRIIQEVIGDRKRLNASAP